MARVGAFALLIVLLACLIGCEEKTASVQQTGINLQFENCISFAVWVWVDGDYIGTYTSEQRSYIGIGPGGHTLFARGNIVVADSSYCWTQSFSVSDGQITDVRLNCRGAKCETPGAAVNPPIEP